METQSRVKKETKKKHRRLRRKNVTFEDERGKKSVHTQRGADRRDVVRSVSLQAVEKL
ncbi:Hypothetical predicted protein [Xyrichtys novacula]|uniref:Uncharacterized protein n=1 Tax=Xyrichtys novacula TaxID=13765 RepID=A0AAV1F545_XYRNO|nr:Hypothetical predicted protein [Xyrichtys novacula]